MNTKHASLATRRVALGILGAASVALAMGSAAFAQDLKGEGEVVVAHWGGIDGAAVESLLPRFTEETGIDVVGVEVGDADYGPKLVLQQRTGNAEWDVALGMLVDHFSAVDQDGMFAGLDTSKWDPDVVSAYMDAGLMGENWAAGPSEGLWLLYGPALDDNPPTSWADFFDLEKYPGNRAMSAGGAGILANLQYALIADGVSPDELYPLDVDRALAKLSTIRDNLVLWEASPKGIEALVAGDVVMDWAFGPSVFRALDADQPVRLAIEGLQTAVDRTRDAVLANGANQENAQIFLTWWKQPEIQAAYAEATKGGLIVPIDAVIEKVDPALQDSLPFSSQYGDDAFFFLDDPWYNEIDPDTGKTNLDGVIAAFTAWRIGL
ncbi:ABC transporter substrate-binding protein [Paracoccus albus]|uniref:ABC transporter substrate-binding protein n=1 Tax=Paracoccus albus TaxID=3017784 RepID=UPI0022F0AC97|nr:extracellular solute-binding protein [Paracoccus albus]WBU60905.1 extracellular solute-binding protein [Paracoccus albus]